MGYYDKYLEHHGILGQKWGKKSGPPYPLSQQAHNAVTSKATDEERKAAAERGGGSAASLHTENGGQQKRSFDKEKAKKIAKGVAVGVGAAAATYGAVKWAKEYRDMPDFLKKELEKAGKTKIKDIENAGKKRLLKAGDAMIDAAIVSVGSIAITKVVNKLAPKQDASQLEKDASKVATDAVSAGIRTATNPSGKHFNSSNSQSNSSIKVDKNSKEYQKLFSGLEDDNARDEIKKRANNGATLEELQEYRRSINHAEFEDWASKYMGVEIGW